MTTDLLKLEPSAVTFATAEESILLDPEDLYSRAVAQARYAHGLTIEEAASGNFPSHLSGARADESLPSTVRRERATGIFPPATPGEIQHQALLNKASRHTKAQKLEKLLAAGTLTLSDTKGYRIRVAYRLLRQMARVRGILTGYEMLQNVLGLNVGNTGVNQWALPQKLAQSGFLTGMRGARNILLKTETGRDRYTFNTNDGYRGFKGVTTLPPPIPDHLYPVQTPEGIWGWRLSRAVPDEYSVAKDMPLILYCEAMTVLSEQVGIHHGAPQEPWSGEYGLAGLLNPTIARVAWPTRDELVMYEEELVLLIYDKLMQMSVRSTEQYMQDYFGYTRFEALDIVKTAKSIGPLLYNESAEVEKAILIKQIDAIAEKCDLADDPRAELATLKLKAQLFGLTANEENEGLAALRDAAISSAKYEAEEDE